MGIKTVRPSRNLVGNAPYPMIYEVNCLARFALVEGKLDIAGQANPNFTSEPNTRTIAIPRTHQISSKELTRWAVADTADLNESNPNHGKFEKLVFRSSGVN